MWNLTPAWLINIGRLLNNYKTFHNFYYYKENLSLVIMHWTTFICTFSSMYFSVSPWRLKMTVAGKSQESVTTSEKPILSMTFWHIVWTKFNPIQRLVVRVCTPVLVWETLAMPLTFNKYFNNWITKQLCCCWHILPGWKDQAQVGRKADKHFGDCR